MSISYLSTSSTATLITRGVVLFSPTYHTTIIRQISGRKAKQQTVRREIYEAHNQSETKKTR